MRDIDIEDDYGEIDFAVDVLLADLDKPSEDDRQRARDLVCGRFAAGHRGVLLFMQRGA